jgi:hypothetical protein
MSVAMIGRISARAAFVPLDAPARVADEIAAFVPV